MEGKGDSGRRRGALDAEGLLQDSGESGANGGLFDDRFTEDNGGITADKIERVLVEDG